MTVTATADSCFGDDQVWPPGFRFHPTDEELVLYYLKRKICRRKLKLDIIRETDVYKWDPEELPAQSILKTGDRLWFFFSPRDRKYPNAARSNRATRHGYWKATGKDRTVTCNSRTVGVKKTLVFYRGRAPNGERTDWVMHEYTVDEEELKRCQNVKDYYALYKLYKKSGPGPKNGEQYGAPFKEEEWADEEYANNPVDTITPVKQPNEAIPDDNVKANDQIQSPLNDNEEFMRQLADEPALPEPQAHFDYVFCQVIGEEEIQSTLLDPSPRDVHFPEPLEVVHDHASFEFSQSPTSPLNDIEEIMRQLADEAPLPQPQAHFDSVLPQVIIEEEIQSTLPDPSPRDVLFPEPLEVVHDHASFEFSQSPTSPLHDTSQLQLLEVPDVNFLDLCEENFLEIDDLINSDTLTSNVEKPVENGQQFNQLDGLGEFDLYHDAAMYLQDIGPIDPGTGPFSYAENMIDLVSYQLEPQSNISLMDQQLKPQSNINLMDLQLQQQSNTNLMDQQLQPQLNATGDNQQWQTQLNAIGDNQQSQSQVNTIGDNQVDYQLQFQSVGNELEQQLQMDQISGVICTNDQIGDVFTPPGSNLGNASPNSGLIYNFIKQDQGDRNSDGASRFSSALWSFLESIPTNPASASERPLVNRAFERMSSFSRLRLNARNTDASTVNGAATAWRTGRNRGFFFISILGALCAILWFLIGTVRILGSSISS